jgi:hypothetical protein
MERWHTAISYTGLGRYFQPLRHFANSQLAIVLFSFNTQNKGIILHSDVTDCFVTNEAH